MHQVAQLIVNCLGYSAIMTSGLDVTMHHRPLILPQNAIQQNLHKFCQIEIAELSFLFLWGGEY